MFSIFPCKLFYYAEQQRIKDLLNNSMNNQKQEFNFRTICTYLESFIRLTPSTIKVYDVWNFYDQSWHGVKSKVAGLPCYWAEQ